MLKVKWRAILRVGIICLCTSLTCWRGWSCFEKYVTKPQTINLEIVESTPSRIPHVSFCVVNPFNEKEKEWQKRSENQFSQANQTIYCLLFLRIVIFVRWNRRVYWVITGSLIVGLSHSLDTILQAIKIHLIRFSVCTFVNKRT